MDHDFSLLALFWRASPTVQVVMLLLLAASVWGWTVFFQKIAAFRLARRRLSAFEDRFWSGDPLDELYDRVSERPSSAPERIFVAGFAEWQRSIRKDGRIAPGVASRIDRSMDVAIGREADVLTRGLTFLATVGSTAPFVGLFGTVWGIKESFQNIAAEGNTSLAIVAPGIAEALMATGMGLLAAIPAVIFYNKLSTDSARIIAGWEAFSDEFSTLLSREVAGG
ncbi:protein TolQ [Mangrovicoccus sp. HB161399]|uniref:protein TolQ n=1 Tax=Mangrovicoccus sp. HB161399 TaxID=2720392 RepID=UPI0015553499|nr:protein TolQ [Mangrovicoccus sp. HB161399]